MGDACVYDTAVWYPCTVQYCTLKNGGVKKAVKNGAQGQGAMKSLYTGGTAGPAIVVRTRTTMSC